MTTDTLKQAARALRDTKPELAAALEAMAAQEPIAWITQETYARLVDGRTGRTVPVHPGRTRTARIPFYAAPIATPEHDAKVRNAALEEAAKVCENGAAEAADSRVEFACDILSDRIRDLKSTGADHE